MKKLLFYFVTITIIVFFEFLIPRFSFLGLFFIVFVGLYRGSSAGCTIGFITGVVEGVFSIASLGISSFTYSLIGYLVGYIPLRIDETNPVIQILILFFSIVFVKIISGIIEIIFIGNRMPFHFDWTILLILLAPLVFWIFTKWWKIWFEKLVVKR